MRNLKTLPNGRSKKKTALLFVLVTLFIIASLFAANKGWQKNGDVTDAAKKCIIMRGGTGDSLGEHDETTGISVQCDNTLTEINAENVTALARTLDGNFNTVGVAQWQSIKGQHYKAKLLYKPENYIKKSGTNHYHCEVVGIDGKKLAGCLQYWELVNGAWQKK